MAFEASVRWCCKSSWTTKWGLVTYKSARDSNLRTTQYEQPLIFVLLTPLLCNLWHDERYRKVFLLVCLYMFVFFFCALKDHLALTDVCRAIWISRINGTDRIIKQLPALVSLLEDISLNRNAEVDENTTIGHWKVHSRNDAQSFMYYGSHLLFNCFHCHCQRCVKIQAGQFQQSYKEKKKRSFESKG